MRRLFPIFAALVALLAGTAGVRAASAAVKYQFEANALGSLLSGGSSFTAGHSVLDLYGRGVGFSLGVEAGLTDHLGVGVRTGLFRDVKTFAPSLAPARWSTSAGYNRFLAARATDVRRKLSAVPTLAVLQYRAHFTTRFAFYDELGLGVTSFSETADYRRGGTTEFVLSNRQENFSLMFGGGATFDLGPAASLALGMNVLMVPSKDGQIWAGGDNPQFVQIALGIRYPRR